MKIKSFLLNTAAIAGLSVLTYGAVWGGLELIRVAVDAGQDNEFRAKYAERFRVAHEAVITTVYKWYGDDHTNEEVEKFQNVMMEAYHASESYEMWVRGTRERDVQVMDGYQWTLVAIKSAVYKKVWFEQSPILTAMLHSNYAALNMKTK